MATTVTAAITLLSALLGLAYSLWAVARGPATAKTAALYTFARSLALAALAAGAFFAGSVGFLAHAPGAGCGRLCGPLGKKPAPGGGALPHGPAPRGRPAGPFAAAITTVRGKVLSIFPAPASHRPRGLILAAFCGIMHHGML